MVELSPTNSKDSVWSSTLHSNPYIAGDPRGHKLINTGRILNLPPALERPSARV